jgi:hypothetical protein
MSVLELMQLALWNLTGRTSYPPAWGALIFWALGVAVAVSYVGIFLVELSGRLGAGAARRQATPAQPVPALAVVEQEAA